MYIGAAERKGSELEEIAAGPTNAGAGGTAEERELLSVEQTAVTSHMQFSTALSIVRELYHLTIESLIELVLQF